MILHTELARMFRLLEVTLKQSIELLRSDATRYRSSVLLREVGTLQKSQTAMLMAREGCCPVRVPLPERFAVHKLLVSRLRTGREAKSDKDVFQACVLCAVLAESHPGAIESAVAQIPRRAKKYLTPAVKAARRFLEPAHGRAWEELSGAAVGKL